MQCLGFKGGIGTASRRLPARARRLHGGRAGAMQLRTAAAAPDRGHPGGPGAPGARAVLRHHASPRFRRSPASGATVPERRPRASEHGSIIVVLATDAPLLPHQLRGSPGAPRSGIGRMGGIAGAGSGDLFLAFSTTPTGTPGEKGVASVPMLSDDVIDPVYEAAVQATEEAIINAMLGARTMTGAELVSGAGVAARRGARRVGAARAAAGSDSGARAHRGPGLTPPPHARLPAPGRQRMESPPDLAIRLHHQRDEPLQRHREREPAPELQRRQPQHGPEVPPEALRRAVLQPIGHIRHREPRRLEEKGRVQQPDGREVVLGRRQSGPREPRHQRARPHRELLPPGR